MLNYCYKSKSSSHLQFKRDIVVCGFFTFLKTLQVQVLFHFCLVKTTEVGYKTDLFRYAFHESLHLSVLKEDSVYFQCVMHVPFNGLMKDVTDF